jgi:hypothetical protein
MAVIRVAASYVSPTVCAMSEKLAMRFEVVSPGLAAAVTEGDRLHGPERPVLDVAEHRGRGAALTAQWQS